MMRYCHLKEGQRSQSTLDYYKKICTDLGSSFEADKLTFEQQKKQVLACVSSCSTCSPAIVECFSRSSKPKSDFLNGSHDSNHHVPNGLVKLDNNNTSDKLMEKLDAQEEHLRQVELELAQTKLALVETKCYNQELSHQIHQLLQALKEAQEIEQEEEVEAGLSQYIYEFSRWSASFLK
uniref:Uncharacterized protein n=1 Tax=Ditylenchus dipsaci TaxID=166011 RepID=A0A915ER08_9BILA